MLSGAGIDAGALACATCLGAGIMTICMGIFANRPLACASGLGINAMIAGITTTVCGGDWHVAMSVIFLEGIVILLLVLCGLREAIMDASRLSCVTPSRWVWACSSHDWPVRCRHYHRWRRYTRRSGRHHLPHLHRRHHLHPGDGRPRLPQRPRLAAHRHRRRRHRRYPPRCDPAPTGIIAPLDFSSIGGPIADAGGVPAIVKVLTDPALLVISFSLLMSDFFDTMGTAMAVAKQGEFLTDDGNVENIKEILIVDSAAAAVGGFMGVSSITTFVESTSGAADGGRTGLTSVTTGVLFILAAFFSPIVTIVSSAATCGALVYVGYLMMSEASEIDWSDVSQGFPAFMIVAGVPFTYSISAGIGLGFIAT